MDRRCYEELLDERKNMELTYEERIAQLQDQHAEVRQAFLSSSLLCRLNTAVASFLALQKKTL